jgi:hypothetical protein
MNQSRPPDPEGDELLAADMARRVAAGGAGEPEVFRLPDRREAFASVNAVADDAWRRFGR